MSFATPGSGDPRITAALAHMAAFRQADVSEMTLDLYSAQLTADGCLADDVTVACERHARAERAEGETAFPSLGQMQRLVAQARSERAKREYEAHGGKYLPAAPDVKPVSKARAKVWLQRIEHVAKGRGTPDDAARLFPMPDESANA